MKIGLIDGNESIFIKSNKTSKILVNEGTKKNVNIEVKSDYYE